MADAVPVKVELSEADYLALLKGAPKGRRVVARLIAAAEITRGQTTVYVVTSSIGDALALRAVALIHAPGALPAIELALKRARER